MGVAMVPEKSLLAGTAESSPWGAFRVIAVSAVPRPSSCERRIDQKNAVSRVSNTKGPAQNQTLSKHLFNFDQMRNHAP